MRSIELAGLFVLKIQYKQGIIGLDIFNLNLGEGAIILDNFLKVVLVCLEIFGR